MDLICSPRQIQWLAFACCILEKRDNGSTEKHMFEVAIPANHIHAVPIELPVGTAWYQLVAWYQGRLLRPRNHSQVLSFRRLNCNAILLWMAVGLYEVCMLLIRYKWSVSFNIDCDGIVHTENMSSMELNTYFCLNMC